VLLMLCLRLVLGPDLVRAGADATAAVEPGRGVRRAGSRVASSQRTAEAPSGRATG
jgi:hypothetical protein